MHQNLFDLTGKLGVVTGAARGLGRAAAVGLARHGADVAAINLDRERCDRRSAKSRTWGNDRSPTAATWPRRPPCERPWSKSSGTSAAWISW